ncbi:unnamed protein product, partial [Mesorhabditis belari]|uniref:Uncharacterized protein n=1 Tax=Mesorhabditis belari TaxID=2138241 RepID=A0AAF3J6A0_9BILA
MSVLLISVVLLIQQINAEDCPPVPASVTWDPIGEANPDYWGYQAWCSSANGNYYSCYNDGTSDKCYLKACDPLPASVTSDPVEDANFQFMVGGCSNRSMQCYFDGVANKCYFDVCPPLPTSITWGPEIVATFDQYDDGCNGNRLKCYNDGDADGCYLPFKGPCPSKPATVNWAPVGPARFDMFMERACDLGQDCYNDGETDQCYKTEGRCMPKPDSVFNEPTGAAIAGKCPEGYACYHDGDINQCYCHDIAGMYICHAGPCGQLSNLCAKTCGFCVGPGPAWPYPMTAAPNIAY